MEMPDQAKQLINKYQHLKINGKRVRTPYFRNVKRVRAGLRSLIGKGTPEEIEDETLIYSKLRGVPLKGKTEEQIREFMESQGIGIDCSGFAVHLYDTWLKAIGKGSIYRNINFPETNLYRRIIRWLRPVENIGANLLTGPLNADPIPLRRVRVGDMVRTKGIKRGHHIMIIYEVRSDPETGTPTDITYVHSTEEYGKDNGVRFGEIEITDPDAELKDQKWLETDENGKCWSYEKLMNQYEDNGLRRPRFFAGKQNSDNH